MTGRLRYIVIMSLVYLLTACASRINTTEQTNCVFPDSPRFAAPTFVCEPEIPGFPLTVLRSSPKSDAAVSERIDQVYHDQVAVWVSAWSQQWYDEPEQQQLAEQFLFEYVHDRARVVRSRVSPKETLWLLIALPLTETELQQLVYDEIAPQNGTF